MRGSSRGGIYLRSLNGYPAKRHALGRLDEHAREQQPERCSVIDHQDRAGLAVPGTSGDPTQLYEGPTEWCAEMAGLPIPRRSVRDRLARRPMVPRSPHIIRHRPDSLRSRGRRCSSKGCASTEEPAKAAATVGVGDARPRRRSARRLPAGSTDLRRMVLPSTLAAPWSAPVRPLPWAVLASGRSGAGSRRRALAAPPPRRAGRRRSARAARSGRRS